MACQRKRKQAHQSATGGQNTPSLTPSAHTPNIGRPVLPARTSASSRRDTIHPIPITEANIDRMRRTLPCDQAEKIKSGCVTWTFDDKGIRGTITIWPDGTGAVCWNGSSVWDRWDKRLKVLIIDADATGKTFWVTPDGTPIAKYGDGEMVLRDADRWITTIRAAHHTGRGYSIKSA